MSERLWALYQVSDLCELRDLLTATARWDAAERGRCRLRSWARAWWRTWSETPYRKPS